MGSYMVIGMGRFGSSVAMELFSLGHEVLILDEYEENVARLAEHVTSAMIGDAKDEAVLGSVGVKNFDCVVVAMAGSIEDSILITLLLKESGARKIVCKAKNERHAKALTLIGADQVVRPEYDMGQRVARSLSQNNIIDFIDLSSEYRIEEMTMPKQWAGKSIMANNLRRKYGITILAIRDADTKKVNISPNADVVLRAEDILVVIGAIEDLNAINKLK